MYNTGHKVFVGRGAGETYFFVFHSIVLFASLVEVFALLNSGRTTIGGGKGRARRVTLPTRYLPLQHGTEKDNHS